MALDCSKITTAPKVQVSRVHNKRVQNEADGTGRVPVYAWNRLRPRAKRAGRAQCRARWWLNDPAVRKQSKIPVCRCAAKGQADARSARRL